MAERSVEEIAEECCRALLDGYGSITNGVVLALRAERATADALRKQVAELVAVAKAVGRTKADVIPNDVAMAYIALSAEMLDLLEVTP